MTRRIRVGGSHLMPVHRLDSSDRSTLASSAGGSTPLSASAQSRQSATAVAKAPPARTGGQHRAAVTPRPVRASSRRIPGHAPWAVDSPRTEPQEFRPTAPSTPAQRPDQVRSLRRVGIDRQSRRSLVLGGALVIAILGGAGVIAWAAKPAATQPAFSVDAGNDTGRADSSFTPRNGQSISKEAPSADPADGLSVTGNGTAPSAGAALGATTGETQRPVSVQADHGPATVSELRPGDPGFGWPSTAFGTARAGSGT